MPQKTNLPNIAAVDTIEWVQRGITICEDKKGEQIVVYDMRGESVLTDYCLICSAVNVPQLRAIMRELELKFKGLGRLPRSLEGTPESQWIILDYGDLLIHLFHQETREFYDLESLISPERRIYPKPEPVNEAPPAPEERPSRRPTRPRTPRASRRRQ